MTQYHRYLKSWTSERGITSFLGTDKPEFQRDWKEEKKSTVRFGEPAKKRAMEITTVPMEIAEPTVSEKKTGLKIEEKAKEEKRRPLNERQRGEKSRAANTYKYDPVSGNKQLGREVRRIYGDYMKLVKKKPVRNLQKMTKTEILDEIEFELKLSVEEMEEILKPYYIEERKAYFRAMSPARRERLGIKL